MGGLLSFLYGVAAYLGCLAALLYFIAFSGNLLVPRSVDVGASATWLEALATDLLLLALFGVQHSVMARKSFKRWWTRVVPRPLERSTYVVATCAVLTVMFWFWLPITSPVVWQVERMPGVAVLWTLFGLGWALALVSTFLLNHFELFGLQQVFARLTHRAVPEAEFRAPMLYRYVRHPLYVGLLLGLWLTPVMTAGRLLFALGLSLYILIGITFEERDLLRQFGERYRNYREQVGMLMPRGKSSRPTMGNATDDAGRDPFDDGRALQDRLAAHCFGCGTLNAHGLHIKSRWEGDDFVCVWQPKPEHIGFPGLVYGGTIASVVDCHAVWAALSAHCRRAGHDLSSGPPPFGVVTARLIVNYLKPASVTRPLEVRARIVEHGDRKSIIACSVRQGAEECATAEVVTVRVQGR